MTDRTPGITRRKIIIRGTVIAAVITAPSLAAFFIGWLVLGDLIQAAIIGAAVHFVSMVLSLKIIKKFFVGGAKA